MFGKRHLHLTHELLGRLRKEREAWPEFVALLLDHVEGLCPVCAEVLGEFIEERHADELERMNALGSSGPSPEFFAALKQAGEEVTRRQQRALRELEELLALAPHERRLRVQRSLRRFRTPQLSELLLAECHKRVVADPREAYHLAQLAMDIVLLLPEDRLASPDAEGLLARSLAAKGNALRAEGDLPAAEEVMVAAWTRVGVSADPLVEAEVAELQASLRKDQRRFEEALELLDRAEAIYQGVGATERMAVLLLTRAAVLFHAGDVQGALEPLEGASRLLEKVRGGGDLLMTARHNLALYLATLERYDEAKAILRQSADLYERHPEHRVRLEWLEGRIALGEGRLEEAEATFVRVRRVFNESERGYYVALVSLDLALVYLEQGRTAQIRALAEEIIPLFEALQVGREARAAALLFQRAAAQDEITREIVRKIASELERSGANSTRRSKKPS